MKTDIYTEHDELVLRLAQCCARNTILRDINAELLAMLKQVLEDSKSETDFHGVTTVDEEAVARLIAKAESAKNH